MADRSPPLLTQLWQQVHFEMKDAMRQAIALPRRDWFKSQASPATGVGCSASLRIPCNDEADPATQIRSPPLIPD